MKLSEKIDTVYKKAIAGELTSYPQLFDALRDNGVQYYQVKVSSHTIEYFGDNEHVVHEGPVGFNAEVGQFNELGVIQAIRRSQRRETDYPTFLKEIAAAGISNYRVDMNERTVSYFGQDPAHKYIEKVPVIS